MRANSEGAAPSDWNLSADAALSALAPTDATITKCLRLGVNGAMSPDSWAELSSCEWDGVAESARMHGVGPLLYGLLRRHEAIGAVPPDVAEGLRASYLHSAAYTAFGEAELGRILATMNDAGIDIMLVRGPALGLELYADSAERPYRDFDLVVREGCWPAFREAMLDLGYQPGRNDAPVLPPRLTPQVGLDHRFDFVGKHGLIVEVKFDLLELGLRMRRLGEAWDEAHQTVMGGGIVVRPSLEDELLMLCVHLNRHGFQRLVWLYDIALFVDRNRDSIDWAKLARCAERDGVLPSVHYTLRLAVTLLSADVPEEAFALTSPPRLAGLVWRSMWPMSDVLRFRGVHEAGLVFRKRVTDAWLPSNILVTGRAADKAAYFARRLFPPRAFLLQKYGGERDEPYAQLLARRYVSTIRTPREQTEHAR